jgi:CheY-like chemotaxis protein
MTETYSDFDLRTHGVLVVNDSSRVRALLGQRLNNRGFAVWRATNGLEAIQVYSENPGIDLVLIDLDMPVMDGPKTLAALRELNPVVRCLFLDGEACDRSADQHPMNLGGELVLSKSLGLVELDRIVSELLLLEPSETGEWAPAN